MRNSRHCVASTAIGTLATKLFLRLNSRRAIDKTIGPHVLHDATSTRVFSPLKLSQQLQKKQIWKHENKTVRSTSSNDSISSSGASATAKPSYDSRYRYKTARGSLKKTVSEFDAQFFRSQMFLQRQIIMNHLPSSTFQHGPFSTCLRLPLNFARDVAAIVETQESI
jgi:hypothetical protein